MVSGPVQQSSVFVVGIGIGPVRSVLFATVSKAGAVAESLFHVYGNLLFLVFPFNN